MGEIITPQERLSSIMVNFNYYSAREAIDEIASISGWDTIKTYIDSKIHKIMINGKTVNWYKETVSYDDLCDFLGENHLSITVRELHENSGYCLYVGDDYILAVDGMVINAFNTGNA